MGAIIGTPRYMSPEQCTGAAPLTPASDVYSLGKVLCEIYLGRSVAESTREAAIPADLSPERGQEELLEIIRHACAEDAHHRYKTVKELQADLMQLRDRHGARP